MQRENVRRFRAPAVPRKNLKPVLGLDIYEYIYIYIYTYMHFQACIADLLNSFLRSTRKLPYVQLRFVVEGSRFAKLTSSPQQILFSLAQESQRTVAGRSESPSHKQTALDPCVATPSQSFRNRRPRKTPGSLA